MLAYHIIKRLVSENIFSSSPPQFASVYAVAVAAASALDYALINERLLLLEIYLTKIITNNAYDQ